jgi:hypothetical protein
MQGIHTLLTLDVRAASSVYEYQLHAVFEESLFDQ